MNTKQYQDAVLGFDCHPKELRLHAHVFGLNEEAGEVAGKLCKAHRAKTEFSQADLIHEVGDCLWRIAAICNELDVGLDYVMKKNIDKLNDRLKRGKIIGEGDNR